MQARERACGRLIGVGLAGYVEVTGMGPSRLMAAMGNRQGGYETAVVRLDPSGRATVFTGIIEIGQGIRSSLAQVAAEVLTLPHDRVRLARSAQKERHEHPRSTPQKGSGQAGSS